jgi:hypothetical protein
MQLFLHFISLLIICSISLQQPDHGTESAARDDGKEEKQKKKKHKDASAHSPRQSPRLMAAAASSAVPSIDVGSKHKADATPEAPSVAGASSRSGSRAGDVCNFFLLHSNSLSLSLTCLTGTPFKRVDESEWIGSKFHITKDNSYFALGLDQSE